MKRILLLTLALYREFVVYNLIFTAAATTWFFYFGWSAYTTIIWIKVVGFALAAVFYWFFRKSRLLFFYNFHLNRRQLLGIAFAMDTLQTLTILSVFNLFR